MSEQTGSDAAGTTDGTSAPPVGVEIAADTTGGEAGNAHPGDPADRELAAVTEAMAQARAGVPTPTDTPALPDDDEVAGLERAHEALRATLDRVDRGG